MASMNEYCVEILDYAKNDIREITATFIMLGSRKGAERVRQKFIKNFQQLKMFPYSGPLVNDDDLSKMGIRMIVVEKFIVFYKVFENAEKVTVYRVLNSKTNYTATMKKMKRDFGDDE